MLRRTLGSDIRANRLVIGVHPDEDIFLTFQAINPGMRLCLRTVGLNFSFARGVRGPKPDAYEKAPLDVMVGDQTLFWHHLGLELCWAFLDPILACSETCLESFMKLHPYAAGSMGPEAALEMLPAGSWPEKP